MVDAAGAAAPRRQRVWLSWSSGKDCAWALHQLRQRRDVDVVGLLTTINEVADRVAMHGVRSSLLRQQAAATGLPVHEVALPYPCSNADYEERMTAAIAAAQAAGVDAVAFGDLFLQDIRAYREAQMRPTGLGTLFPLWLGARAGSSSDSAGGGGDNGGGDSDNGDVGAATAALAAEMVAAGLQAVIVCVDPKRMPASLAGRRWDELVASGGLPAGVDTCGEHGEFHTLAIAGPMFRQRLDVVTGQVVERDGFVFCDMLAAAAAAGEPGRAAAPCDGGGSAE